MNMSLNKINVSLLYSGPVKAETLIFEKLLSSPIIKVNVSLVSS